MSQSTTTIKSKYYVIQKKTPELEHRFWSKVNRQGPRQPHMSTRCWIWIGTISKFGYGQFWCDNSMRGAHRVSYILQHGLIPNKKELDHKCKMRSCVRPSHLRPCTHKQNHRWARKKFCYNGHPLDRKKGKSNCIICARERRRKWREKNNKNWQATRRQRYREARKQGLSVKAAQDVR